MIENLQNRPIKIRRHQIIAYLHLTPVEEINQVHEFGSLDESGQSIGLHLGAMVVVPREKLSGLSKDQKAQVEALFQKYKEVFAVDDHDLGCTQGGVVHRLETEDHPPIRSWPIH